VLLFTPERLTFKSIGQYEDVGDLQTPDAPFLIIDGQHRLAALHFHLKAHPDEAASIRIPCMVFDGRAEDFAAEMFVIINSTPTRINKSHLVELYERVAYVGADRKLAAAVVKKLYAEDDSPLRYRINRLGGRSSKEKWILQAEVFNEMHRWVVNQGLAEDEGRIRPEKLYGQVRDFFKATAAVFDDNWGDAAFMLTKPVMLKAFIRVCADLCDRDAEPVEDRVARWTERLAPWAKRLRDFRADGFYERFPAKGQIERVVKLHRELGQAIGINKKEGKAEKA
jgi:DGQHR domain-containing protein